MEQVTRGTRMGASPLLPACLKLYCTCRSPGCANDRNGKNRLAEPQTSFLLRARLLGALTGVRGEERRSAFAALFTLASFMAGHALLETARDALFLASWPASALPWAYLAIAGLA